jgi:hypothetical protein
MRNAYNKSDNKKKFNTLLIKAFYFNYYKRYLMKIRLIMSITTLFRNKLID